MDHLSGNYITQHGPSDSLDGSLDRVCRGEDLWTLRFKAGDYKLYLSLTPAKARALHTALTDLMVWTTDKTVAL